MKFEEHLPGIDQFLSSLSGYVKSAPVGSCRVPGYDAADLDIGVLVETKGSAFGWINSTLSGHGAVLPVLGEYDVSECWATCRIGIVNYLVTTDAGWYDRMLVANEVIEALGLTDKGDRIVVNRIVRDGYKATEANARRDGSR